MGRVPVLRQAFPEGLPRVSGDGPAKLLSPVGGVMVAPRERGWVVDDNYLGRSTTTILAG